MKKLSKLLLVLGVFLTLGALRVNAETKYIGDKKYTFTEFNSEKMLFGTFKSDGKTYTIAFDDLIGSDEELPIYELEFGEKINLKKVKDAEKFIEELESKVEDQEYISYEFRDRYSNDDGKDKFYKVTEKGEDKKEKEIDLDFLNIENTFVYYLGEIKDKLFFSISSFDNDKIVVLNKKYETVKTIDKQNIIKKINKDKKSDEETYFSMHLATLSKNEEPYIIVIEQFYSDEILNEKYYVFDYNEDLLLTINDEKNVMDFSPIFKDKEVKFLYQSCELNEEKHEYELCELNTIDLKGNKDSIIKGKSYIYNDISDGFITVTNENKNKKEIILYDNNLNVIFKGEYDSILFYSVKDIENSSTSDFSDINDYKEVQNGDYVLSLYKYNEDYSIEESVIYYLTVEDSSKTTITGTVKDKDGNPLNNYTVELHSTPRTVKTDANGYFKFEDVEEGEHTITIIDPEGNTVATKKLNVIASNETRLDGDTLYFDGTGKGLDIELKVDGETLSIEKVLNEPKEKSLIKLLSNEKVPKTGDSIILYIIMLIALVGGGTLLKRKINKMN